MRRTFLPLREETCAVWETAQGIRPNAVADLALGHGNATKLAYISGSSFEAYGN